MSKEAVKGKKIERVLAWLDNDQPEETIVQWMWFKKWLFLSMLCGTEPECINQYVFSETDIVRWFDRAGNLMIEEAIEWSEAMRRTWPADRTEDEVEGPEGAAK